MIRYDKCKQKYLTATPHTRYLRSDAADWNSAIRWRCPVASKL